MSNFLDSLYIRFLLSPGGSVLFWSGQSSFWCWLVGHDFNNEDCTRCKMGLSYFLANRSGLTKGGLFLKWRMEIFIGKVCEVIEKAIAWMGFLS